MDTIKKIRRSISSTVTGNSGVIVTNGSQGAPNGMSPGSAGEARYEGRKGHKWVHPPDVLVHGTVTYTLRLMGTRPVDEPRGTEVCRKAIQAIHFENTQRRAETSHSGSKAQKVDLRINVDSVAVLDSRNKVVLFKYPLPRISYATDDKVDRRMFCFIAKDDSKSNFRCLVFASDRLAEEITLTIGEAFDLNYKQYMSQQKAPLQMKRENLMLQRKVAVLEEENQRLVTLLQETRQASGGHQQQRRSNGSSALEGELLSLASPTTVPSSGNFASSLPSPIRYENHNNPELSILDQPILPVTPVPSGPPPSLPSGLLPPPSSLLTSPPVSTSPAPVTHQQPAILAPPPPVAPRRKPTTNQQNTASSDAKNGVDSLFDDHFDSKRLVKKVESSREENLNRELLEVEKQLRDLESVSSEAGFELGECPSDAFKELRSYADDAVAYSTPQNTVDPKRLQEASAQKP